MRQEKDLLMQKEKAVSFFKLLQSLNFGVKVNDKTYQQNISSILVIEMFKIKVWFMLQSKQRISSFNLLITTKCKLKCFNCKGNNLFFYYILETL